MSKLLGAITAVLMVLVMLNSSTDTMNRQPAVVSKVLPVIKSKVSGEIRVMIIDSGIGQNSSIDSFVQRDGSFHYNDEVHHGTHIAGLVVLGPITDPKSKADSVCKNVKIFSCRYYLDSSQEGKVSLKKSIECLKMANSMNIDLINYSGGGADFSTEEHSEMSKFVNSGGVIVAAAGNDGQSLLKDQYFPASYGLQNFNGYSKLKNFVVVQSVCSGGNICSTSNTHPDAWRESGEGILSTLPNNLYGKMSGTSQATAIMSHKLIQFKCRGSK